MFIVTLNLNGLRMHAGKKFLDGMSWSYYPDRAQKFFTEAMARDAVIKAQTFTKPAHLKRIEIVKIDVNNCSVQKAGGVK